MRQQKIPDYCKQCAVSQIGSMALDAGSSLNIMTSARDILFDVFLPAIKGRTAQPALFGFFRYSLEPFKIALYVADIYARLFTFESGSCLDYSSGRKAYKGIKLEQTKLKDRDVSTIIHELESSV